MAPIPLKRVVSVTSEDPLNPASNLLGINSTAGKKWLSSCDNKSRRAEVILELAKRSRITSLEIANFGSAFVEVLVGNCDRSPDNFTTLLPSSMLMSIADSRGGRGKTTILKCGREKLSKSAVDMKWSLVKIQISQKFNLTEQFGLHHVAFHNDTPTSYKPFRQSEPTLTPTHTPLSPPTPSAQTTPRHRIPPLPGQLTPTEHAQKLKNGTPKRPSKAASDDEEDYEFAGIERQSRLFKNCVKGTSDGDAKQESNTILERISSDKKRYSEKLAFDPTYQRRRLLKKELPKAESKLDFAQTFKEENTKKSLALGLSGLSAFDDETEIGEEVEDKWAWRKRGKRRIKHPESVAPRGWLSKKRKIDKLIVECESLVKGAETSCSLAKENHPPKAAPLTNDDLSHIQEVDPNDDPSACDSGEDVEVVGGGSMVECPVCGVMLPGYAIEVHASTCGETRPAVGIIYID